MSQRTPSSLGEQVEPGTGARLVRPGHDERVDQDPQVAGLAAGRRGGGAQAQSQVERLVAGAGADPDHVGVPGGQAERLVGAHSHHDRRLTLRGPRGDRRTLDREVHAVVLDVVQLRAVDVPVGGLVADLCVVLPAVPQRRDDLDGLLGLGHCARLGKSGAASEVNSVLLAVLVRGPPELPAGAAAAHVVDGRDRLGHVERLRVGRRDRRHQADPAGPGGEPCRDQGGVETPPQGRGPGGLQRERVVDHDEVERPALGGVHQVLEPFGVEEALGLRAVGAPGGRVGAGVAEVDAEVQGPGRRGACHGRGPFMSRGGAPRTGARRSVRGVRGRASAETAVPSIGGSSGAGQAREGVSDNRC